ncbi:hypothetical protein ACI3L1_06745 [Deinococcus sp. SM5_A1]|uniref:hypothetical protein n=1 Tax=Deinococcus sp. SM5_A1 TaxID=3379094 RepID=UPI00385DF0F7
MARSVELQNADGTPLTAFDFGTVLPGTTSAPHPVQFKNTGDIAVTLKAWIENVIPADGTLALAFGGVAVLGVDQGNASTLGILAPGVVLTGDASYTVPALSEGVMQIQSRLKFQYS